MKTPPLHEATPEHDLTKAQARVLELMWQGCSEQCRQELRRSEPKAIALVEKVLGRPLEIA